MNNTENIKDVTNLGKEELTKAEASAVPLEDDELDAATGGISGLINPIAIRLQAEPEGRTICFKSRVPEGGGYELASESKPVCSCPLEYKWAKDWDTAYEDGYVALHLMHSKCYNCGWTETGVYYHKKQRY